MQISEGSVTIENDEKIFYRKSGNGEKILLLIHGNISSSRYWKIFMSKFPSDFTLYAVDMRGFGDSSYNKPIDSLADLAEDMVMFTRKMNLNRVTPVGWSTGGGVGMLMAALYPELVEKLILVESISYNGFPIYRKNEKGEPIIGSFYSSKEELAADPVQVAPVVEAYKTGNSDLLKFLWDQMIYVTNKPDPQEFEKNIETTMKQRNLVDLDWALATFNISHSYNGVSEGNGLVDQVKCPVLAFWGDRDLVVTRDMAEGTVKAIGENARLVILEGCGHSPFTDNPDQMLEEIIKFMG